MAGDKTEQPTPKRLRESREKGQVFKSKDVIQAVLFATAAAVLTVGGSRYVTELKNLIKFTIVFWILYQTIRNGLRDIVPTAGIDLEETAALAGHLVTTILYKVAAVFIVIGGADYMIQKKLYM